MGCVQGGKSSNIPFLAYLDFGNRAPSANSFNVFQISPGPNVTGVSLNTSIQVGFSQKLDPSSIQSQTIQLTQGNSVIAGSLTSTEKTLLFNPTSALAASKVYTVRVSKDIKSEGGSSLSEDYVWNFTTGSVVDAIAPDLSLRTPAINATLVPNTTSVQVALTETMDCTSVNGGTLSLKNTTTGLYEAGPVACVNSVITFTPTFPLAYNTTYRVDLFSTAKDLANNTLANSYNWNFTTGPGPDAVPPTLSFISPAPNSLNVPVNSAVSIAFSEPINCGTVGNIVLHNTTLAAGTTVGVGVACANTAMTLTPAVNLDPNTTYSVIFSNAVTDLGGGIGLNPVPAPSTFTTAPTPVVDNTPPTVTSKVPAAAATGVGLNTIPMAVFSEPMNCASITTASFRLKETGSPTYLNGSVQCSGTSATWTPDATNPLAANTQYTVEVTAAAVDASTSNNALNPPVVGPLNLWNFTTGPGLDTIRPTVVVVTPENGASGVSINGGANIAFSETIDCPNIGGKIILDDEPTFALPNIAININCNGNTASFTPAAALAFNTPYYAKIRSTVTDTATNSMNADYDWSFTTGAAADITAPQISLSAPASGATGIPTNATITVAFNESINCSTLNLTVNNGINGTTTCSGSSATFTPNALPFPLTPLNASTTYTVTVAAGVKDIAGNTMAASNWNFTTGAAADTVAPTVTIQNLRDKSIVESGFVIGTVADARGIARVEVNIDSAGWGVDASFGTTSWKFALPTGLNTWKPNSLHTIQVRATDTSNNVTYSGPINVRKGTNKDINGDGYADLVAAGNSAGLGLVYIFYSSGTAGITTTLTSGSFYIAGGVATEEFGRSLGLGDINGDGYADLVVGAPGYSSSKGAVYVFHSSGSSAGITISASGFASSIITGASNNDQLGISISTGDINGDGYADLIAGAPMAAPSVAPSAPFPAAVVSKGRVYIFHSTGANGVTAVSTGAASSNLLGGAFGYYLGSSLTTGNVNGDNYDDVVIGSTGYNSARGQVLIYHGSNTGIGGVSTTLSNNTGGANGLFGFAIATGDVNGDGYSDVIASGYAMSGSKGQISVHTSQATTAGVTGTTDINNAVLLIQGAAVGSALGSSLLVKDLNTDGRADIITSEPNGGAGTVHIFMTPNSGTINGSIDTSVATRTLPGISSFGLTNATNVTCPISAGDVNGDGYTDLFVLGNAGGGSSPGAYIFHASNTGISTSNPTLASTIINNLAAGTFGLTIF
ncbi:Ig-like domain-containing protein [Leptospira santarosai]|uniref:Ig-like domain-containing protein n=1 Tax=Leptospira santarosai TaxID=28183 RepID=UPI0024AF4EA5|nr:Ig-like domain-containing protein [Leptospira santarosai]MDI7190544.1 Ig-like domain-containing protein [Leptospira santarosai]MDI7222499.1 Ig-like domain-containing protein [Leptospira santarosai]